MVIAMVDEARVIEKLKSVIDPHTGQSVYDMGLIEDLRVNDGEVSLKFKPSSPFCPLGVQLATSIKTALKEVADKVDITVVGYINEEELNRQLREV
ncbi:metal-sulfur cluster assembly factor [Candidatus Pyrohabitans sp.]